MIDTNTIQQAGDTVAVAATQLKVNWPAVSAAAVIVARELKNFNEWLAGLGAAVIRHGGLLMIVKKLIWNGETKS